MMNDSFLLLSIAHRRGFHESFHCSRSSAGVLPIKNGEGILVMNPLAECVYRSFHALFVRLARERSLGHFNLFLSPSGGIVLSCPRLHLRARTSFNKLCARSFLQPLLIYQNTSSFDVCQTRDLWYLHRRNRQLMGASMCHSSPRMTNTVCSSSLPRKERANHDDVGSVQMSAGRFRRVRPSSRTMKSRAFLVADPWTRERRVVSERDGTESRWYREDFVSFLRP